MKKTDIRSMTLDELEYFVTDGLGDKKFRARQIYDWMHVKLVQSFDEMTNLSKNLRERLNNNADRNRFGSRRCERRFVRLFVSGCFNEQAWDESDTELFSCSGIDGLCGQIDCSFVGGSGVKGVDTGDEDENSGRQKWSVIAGLQIKIKGKLFC